MENDMSPGMLVATGYIAGGAIAGVLIAFLSFTNIPSYLARWEHREYTVSQPQHVEQLCRELADRELGLTAPPVGKQLLSQQEQVADEIRELNGDRIPQYAAVPAATVLALPGGGATTVSAAESLGDVSQRLLGDAGQAQLLLELNADRVRPPEILPAGVKLRLPQRTAPAMMLFGLLALTLAGIGGGWWWKIAASK
jgi:hypothetical protein